MGLSASRRHLCEAELAWLTTGAGLMAVDLWLLRTGKPTLTEVARSRPVLAGAFLTILAAHLVDRLGIVDPFRAVGGLVTRRTVG